MDDKAIDNEQKLIEQQMDATRAALSNKLEALENQVAETVQTATDVVHNTTEAVAETVETVKESVGEISEKVGNTVRSVAGAFDITHQVEERPWLMFAGSIGVGWLGGWYLQRAAGPHPTHAPNGWQGRPAASTAGPREAEQPGWVSNQIGRLKGLAIGMVMAAVRDLAKENLPQPIRDRVAGEVDNLTPHLGGEVIHGSILPKAEPHLEGGTKDRPYENGGQPIYQQTRSFAGERH